MLTYVAIVEFVESGGERITEVVYAGNNWDSATSSITGHIKTESRSKFRAFNIEFWLDGQRIELSDVNIEDNHNA